MAFRQPAQLLVLGTCAALLLPAPPAGGEESGWQHALDRLGLEKTLAEGCISLLKTFAERDPMARVQGQRFYRRAKADVDGLIALLEMDLAGDRSPAAIPELRYRLEAVPRQRQTLCEQVDAAVGSAIREQPERSSAVELLAEGAADPARSLLDAAVRIWEAYRRADETERERIVSAMAGVRWRDYAEVLPGAIWESG